MITMLRRTLLSLSLLFGLHGAASAADSAPASDFWIGLGAGYYGGQDYEPPAGQQKTQAYKVGGWEGVLNANLASGSFLLRARGAWMLDYTNNTAEDVGALLGLALGSRRVYLAAGASRLTDVANDRQRPIVGVPVELLLYPTRGLELAVHGNLNAQSHFIGVTLAGVFGKRRAS